MNLLITGINGFAGSHLADFILNKKDPSLNLYGFILKKSNTENIHHIRDQLKLIEGDITDYPSIKDALDQTRPDRIFHLSAQSSVGSSWKAPADCLTTNIIGELNLFEAVRELKINPRIQIACSGDEYGLITKEDLPINETTPLRPLSPYAVSKVGQDMLAYQYYQSHKFNIVRTRAFTSTGPRQGSLFVCSNFAYQIAQIEKKMIDPLIKVGNLEAQRDFTDVRDVVEAYWLSLEKSMPGEVYNICSGRTYSIKELLDILIKMSTKKIEIKIDQTRLRPSDIYEIRGNNYKIRQATGWEPKISIQKSLKDLLAFWREKKNY